MSYNFTFGRKCVIIKISTIWSAKERIYTMFKIHSFIAGLCAASLCTAMITAHAEEDGVKRVEADTDSVRPLGRTYFMDDTLWLPNSASGVEFTASGSKAAFELTDQGDPSRIGIFVNGELREDKILEDYISTVEVELDPGEHTVSFIKLCWIKTQRSLRPSRKSASLNLSATR